MLPAITLQLAANVAAPCQSYYPHLLSSAAFKHCSAQSLSHTTHKPQYRVEQPETTALMKEQTRIRTMGFPRKVEVKGIAHTATKTAAAAAASAGNTGMHSQTQEAAAAACTAVGGSSSGGAIKKAGKPAVKASDMVDTLSSKVPLKWAASSVVVPGSSYTTAFGSNPGRSPQVRRCDIRRVSFIVLLWRHHRSALADGHDMLYLKRLQEGCICTLQKLQPTHDAYPCCCQLPSSLHT
jgi:hypothetical protein